MSRRLILHAGGDVTSARPAVLEHLRGARRAVMIPYAQSDHDRATARFTEWLSPHGVEITDPQRIRDGEGEFVEEQAFRQSLGIEEVEQLVQGEAELPGRRRLLLPTENVAIDAGSRAGSQPPRRRRQPVRETTKRRPCHRKIVSGRPFETSRIPLGSAPRQRRRRYGLRATEPKSGCPNSPGKPPECSRTVR